MIRRKTFWPRRAAMIAALVLAAFGLRAPGRAAGLGPAQMNADEIKALEQRLTDAGCFKGAIDGATSAALDEAIKACPDQRPFLRIETGMHTAPLNSIGADAACRLLVTTSDDKTVRLWSLSDGKLQRVMRLPIGIGYSGRVFAVGISGDARLIAIGRHDGYFLGDGTAAAIYLYQIGKTGEPSLVRRTTFVSRVTAIAFSRDGSRLAIGFKGPQGIGVAPGSQGVRVIDVGSGRELLADASYGSDVYGLAYAPDDALIAASDDGRLRRYGPDLKLTVSRAAPDGKRPTSVAIDPSGWRVAIGYGDEPTVSILDARTLEPLAKAQNDDLYNGALASVAWSRSGATLVAGGTAREQFQGDSRIFLRRFDANGRRYGADVAASKNSIMDIKPCANGFVFAAADPAFGLLSPRGVVTTLQSPRTADMRDKVGSAFAVSPDASSVRFGLEHGEEKPVLFDLAAASLTDSPNPQSGFAAAQIHGLPVTDWQDTFSPMFKGEKLALEYLDESRALATRPDASGFVLGTNFWIKAYDAKGEERWKRPAPGVSWGVDFSLDGEILVVACDDGTIRWLRWSDGHELLALFVESQSRKWVAWTPSGYYMASAGGENLIGWHVNRGWNQEADFFPASEFRAEYSRPDIVRLVLQTRDEAEAVRRANATSQRTSKAVSVAAALPPVVSIASPKDGAHFSSDSVEIAYSLRSPSGLPIDRLDVLADGQPVRTTGFEKTGAREAEGHAVVTLPRRDVVVALIGRSGDLPSAPVTLSLKYDGPSASPSLSADAADLLKPKLYALLVGVTGYQNPDYDTLKFPARDAESLAEALNAQKGGLYRDVQIEIVDIPARDDLKGKVVGPPTRDNVLDGLYWLKHAATSRDISIVFLSGHGIRDAKQNFWFLTRDADTERLRTTAISNDDLLDLVSSIPGKKVLFIDACHSGVAMVAIKAPLSEAKLDMNKVVNDFSVAGSGLVVYGASMGTETALEDAKWDRHGAFAEALIEAIGEGKASIDSTRRITTDMLDFYIEEHVKEMTGGAQHPVMNRNLIPDFPLALAKP
jgi:WD40 repeat protein/uncharacterized caspase-like protein